MDDIHERDLSKKAYGDYTDEEKEELARRFKEFSELVREKGPKQLGLREKKPAQAGGKKIRKWDPAAMGGKGIGKS